MRLVSVSSFCLGVLFPVMFPMTATAIPTITCHCFTHRSFDPSFPDLADGYFLATSQNAFFCAVFGQKKFDVILKKQLGTSPEDLWIAYWVACRGGGATPEEILKVRRNKQSWQDVFISMRLSDKKAGEKVWMSLKKETSSVRLAAMVVDDLLLQYRLLKKPELETLRQGGASNREMILVSLISIKTGQPAFRLYHQVKNGEKSWGALLDEARIAPSTLQADFASQLSRSR